MNFKLVLVSFTLIFSSIALKAQTSLHLDSLSLDSLSITAHCLGVPISVNVYTETPGYIAGTDSIYTEVDYGDGNVVSDSVIVQDWGSGPHIYLWNLGHIYAAIGEYEIRIVVGASDGNTDTLLISVLVKDVSEVAFSIAPEQYICKNSPVSFRPILDGIASEGWFSWNFGDGSNSWSQGNVTHVYPTSGNYEVSVLFNSWQMCGLSDTTLTDSISVFDDCGDFNLISGHVYIDNDQNCAKSVVDEPLSDAIVHVLPDNFFVTTDSSGYYGVYVDSGTYEVTLNSVNANFACSDSVVKHHVEFNGTSLSNVDYDFAIEPECGFLEVAMSHVGYRPCFGSWYRVSYSNAGFSSIENTYIEITPPEEVTIVTTSTRAIWNQAPYNSTVYDSELNGVYTYNLGTVQSGQVGSFYVLVEIACDAIMGQTLCTKAEIFPHECDLEEVDSTWDKSSVKVTGECLGDSNVCFTILNTGDSGEGDMQGNSEWRLYEDNVLVQTGTFQLNGQDTLQLCFSANGATLRLEADQRAGHPGNSMPRETIELCGPDSSTASLGFVNSVAQDDQNGFTRIYCDEVVNSWDPNDKLASPRGFTSRNYITDSDQLNYRIRFQNTGTAPAINIKVLDTLDFNTLDISSFKMGGCSHSYSYTIFDKGIVEWKFEEINLPDSNASEPESHGFIDFTINQKAGNTKGTFIENTASIYFDFNEAVITNTMSNMVWDTVYSVGSTPENLSNDGLYIYPNPSNGHVNIAVEEDGEYNLAIYNAIGVLVRQEKIIGRARTIDLSTEPEGVYLLKIWNEKMSKVGRIIKQ